MPADSNTKYDLKKNADQENFSKWRAMRMAVISSLPKIFAP